MHGLPVAFFHPSGRVPLALLMNGEFQRGGAEHAQELCTKTHRTLVNDWGGDSVVHTYGVARSDEVVEKVRAAYHPRMVARLLNASTQLHNTRTYLAVFLDYVERRAVYENVLVLRFDLYVLWMPLDIRSSFHVTVPWREAGGHWRKEGLLPFRRGWNSSAHPRVGDAFFGVAFRRLRRLLRVLGEYLQEHPTVFFMHNMARALAEVDTLKFAVSDGMFDSNPCRATCMLNPVYRILPRDMWLVERKVCSRRDDFQFDPVSASICCPSPHHPSRGEDTSYCCPNSVRTCDRSV